MHLSFTSPRRHSAIPSTSLTPSKILTCSHTCAISTLSRATSLLKVKKAHLGALQVTIPGKSCLQFRIKATLMRRRKMRRITQKETQNNSYNKRAQVHNPPRISSQRLQWWIKASQRMTGIYATVCCLSSSSGTTQSSLSCSNRDKVPKVKAVRQTGWPHRRGRSSKSSVEILSSTLSTWGVPRTLSTCQSTMTREASQRAFKAVRLMIRKTNTKCYLKAQISATERLILMLSTFQINQISSNK